jgi:lipoprotein signal peptidase
LLVGVVIVGCDQLTKAAATALGERRFSHPVTNAEFSLGVAGGPLSLMVLITVAGVLAFGVYVVWQTLHGRLAAWVPGALIGGALSNLTDRLLLGAVRDFIPGPGVLWNLADLAVLVGIAGYALGHLHPPRSSLDTTRR